MRFCLEGFNPRSREGSDCPFQKTLVPSLGKDFFEGRSFPFVPKENKNFPKIF